MKFEIVILKFYWWGWFIHKVMLISKLSWDISLTWLYLFVWINCYYIEIKYYVLKELIVWIKINIFDLYKGINI